MSVKIFYGRARFLIVLVKVDMFLMELLNRIVVMPWAGAWRCVGRKLQDKKKIEKSARPNRESNSDLITSFLFHPKHPKPEPYQSKK